jgi:hypothetical protein
MKTLKKITEFYSVSEVKEYTPISCSDLDTIQNLKNPDESLVRLTGLMKLKFSARANNVSIREYTDTFDITIFDNDVIVTARGYE